MVKRFFKAIAELAVFGLFVAGFCWMVYEGFGTPGLNM